MNEGDMFDTENGQIEKEGTQLCPIKSPIFSRDPYRVPSYLEYMRKRIAIVRQIIPSDIPLSINGVGSTHNGAHLAGCSKWRNTPSETPEEALTRLHTFFDGLGASVNNLAINFYPMTFAEVGFLETVIADLGNRYPTKNQITIDETGYSTGSCTDITCETMRRDMIQAIMDTASRIANIPAVMLYYGRQDNEYGIKSANGTPKLAYDAVPFARTISVPSQPTWCTTPILENNINVCDWYSEIEN